MWKTHQTNETTFAFMRLFRNIIQSADNVKQIDLVNSKMNDSDDCDCDPEEKKLRHRIPPSTDMLVQIILIVVYIIIIVVVVFNTSLDFRIYQTNLFYVVHQCL